MRWAMKLVVISNTKQMAKPVASEIRALANSDTLLIAQNPLIIKAQNAPIMAGIA